jgi:hypothetical protein
MVDLTCDENGQVSSAAGSTYDPHRNWEEPDRQSLRRKTLAAISAGRRPSVTGAPPSPPLRRNSPLTRRETLP